MDKILLKQTLQQLAILATNNFSLSSPIDNLKLVKSSLNKMKIEYKSTVEKNREFIHIYYENKLLSKYSKANYPNNKFLGQSICNDKFKTEFYLNLNNVPTPKSEMFLEKDYNKAVKYIKNLPSPFVIKALDLRQGVGVYTDVDHENFTEYWEKAMDLQHKRKNDSPKVIIQNQLDGLEVRINVTEGLVESAILRLHGFLIGDGEHTIEELIFIKNEEKGRNPYLNRDMILFDEELLYTLEKEKKDRKSILEKDEMIILNKKPEIRYGMETYNVTDIVDENILNIGLNAVLAIPGLHTAGVDVIIPDLTSEKGHVIEVNKNPAWVLSLYTDKGEPGTPIDNVFSSHILDYRINNRKIKNKEDISEEDFQKMIERYKFLFNKDRYNRNIISHYHNDLK